MYKGLLTIAALSLCVMLSACNASFVDPVSQLADTTKTPKIDTFSLKWYNSFAHPYKMNGFVVSNHDRCFDSLPAGSHIIVAWELPYYPNQVEAMCIRGSAIIDPNVIRFGFNAGLFNLSMTIDSVLPKGAVWYNADSSQALAVGHLFLINTTSIKEGDTILRSDLQYSDILGGVAETAVVYQKGTPSLLGQPLSNPAISTPGFNFLRGYNGSGGPDPDSHKDMKAVFKSNPNSFYLFIDHDDGDTYKLNPMWLVP